MPAGLVSCLLDAVGTGTKFFLFSWMKVFTKRFTACIPGTLIHDV